MNKIVERQHQFYKIKFPFAQGCFIFLWVCLCEMKLCSYTSRQTHGCVHAHSLYTHTHTHPPRQQTRKRELLNHIAVTAIMTDDCIILERKSLCLSVFVSLFSPSSLLLAQFHWFVSELLYWGQKVNFQRLRKKIKGHTLPLSCTGHRDLRKFLKITHTLSLFYRPPMCMSLL